MKSVMDTSVKSVMDTSVTSSGIKESLEELSPTTTVLSHPFKVVAKMPATVQLTSNSSSSDVPVNNKCDGIMTSSNMPAKLASGKTPTCKVCGDESSGYHYGVDSCEGCKGFFRRCITQGMTHKCSNEEKCEITPFTRNSCQYCRLKKCFAVGMSREASRLGRRPKRLKDCSSEQKRETVVPIAPYPSASELYNVRMAELQKLVQNNGTFKSELMQAFLTAAQVSFKEHQRNNISNDSQKSKKGSMSLSKNHDTESSLGCSSSLHSSSLVNSTLEIDKNPQNQNDYCIDSKDGIIKDTLEGFRLGKAVTMDNSNTTPTNKSEDNGYEEVKLEPHLNSGECSMTDDFMPMQNMPEAGSPYFGISELSPDTMIMMPDMMALIEDDMMSNLMMATNMPDMMNASLTLADDDCCQINVDHIMEEVKQFPSALRKELIDQVIQTVGIAHLATVTPTREIVKLADEKFQQKKLNAMLPNISKPANPRYIWCKFVQNMVAEITKAIQFCKQLPGFSEIVQDDQIVLIKKGSFEILLCRMCLLVDHVTQEMFDPSMEMKSPRLMIQKMPMGYFIDEFFNVAAELNPLNLTDREIGIFSAALIMCPDREGLKNILAIEKLNMLYLQSLYYEMSNNHSDYESLFARLISLIPMFNKVNRRHSLALNNLKMQKAPEIYEFPELHKEIYDIKDD